MPIKVLDSQVVSRIAAGEVVERPASVVKELVENSLDAGATQVSVEVRESGTGLIRVTDNGSGIPPDELELAFGRHATSKLSRFEDFDSILSLGFRGEALASIAAVAEVELTSCVAGASVGAYISWEGGKVVGRGPQGRSPGTTVTVKNLFRQVPARLKFLKSRATENSHIAGVVSRYALSFPEVRFTLSLEGRMTLQTAGSGQLIDSVAQVYGLEIAQNMLEIKPRQWQGDPEATQAVITGLVGSPKIGRSSRDYLSLFVTRRFVNHRLLAWAVAEAYHGLLMIGKHPAAVINISLPPAEVDVNVHPAKTEVRFRNERAVLTAVQRAVRQTLVELAPVPGISEAAAPGRVAARPQPTLWNPVGGGAASVTLRPPETPQTSQTPARSLPVLRVVGQLLGSYIVAEGPDGLYLIDQHAAHERIMFEQVKARHASREIESQTLLEPVPFELSPRQAEVMQVYRDKINEFGFSIEPFGARTLLVRAVPSWLAGQDWPGVIREMLEGGGADWEERLIISIACHSAVRAGQVLSDGEMRELVRQLEQTALPNTCPHGRPTILHLSLGRLEREFGRS